VYIEHQIINIFLEANTDELNLIVMSVELALILYKVAPSPAPTHPHSLAEPSSPLLCPLAHQVKDHRLSRQLNRTKLLQTLAVDRLGELNVSSRAMLLDAIQVRLLSTHPAPTYSNPYLAPILSLLLDATQVRRHNTRPAHSRAGRPRPCPRPIITTALMPLRTPPRLRSACVCQRTTWRSTT
jgi:hypothetical protein